MNRSRLSMYVARRAAVERDDTPASSVPARRAAEDILGLKAQAAVFDAWLKIRLERLIPEIMRQEGFDMWRIICRENAEDPVFFPWSHSRRCRHGA